MPEILTESFCERCGTRYTFESAAPTKTRKLGKFKTLSKGLKNYVMSDETSLDEALAAARSDEERELTSHQLDAFHATFNFCMTCRQYTCGNCWNTAEGRCLTCAPHLGQEVMPAPFPDLPTLESLRLEASAWPTADIPQAEAAQAADEEPAPEFDFTSRLAALSSLGCASPRGFARSPRIRSKMPIVGPPWLFAPPPPLTVRTNDIDPGGGAGVRRRPLSRCAPAGYDVRQDGTAGSQCSIG